MDIEKIEKNGQRIGIQKRLYDEQGIDKVATRHEGYGKKGQENKEYNDEVKELNKLKDKLKTKEIELKTNH